MKRILFFYLTVFMLLDAKGQNGSTQNFYSFVSVSQKKLEAQLSRNKFTLSSGRLSGDTSVKIYGYQPRKKAEKDCSQRVIETWQAGENFGFSLFTLSYDEFLENCQALKKEGYACGSVDGGRQLFQKRNTVIYADSSTDPNGQTVYSLRCEETKLPSAREIVYAEDLLKLYSHEQLLAVFGENNVVKDVYYFSDKEVANSSIIFPKTRRQAVFVWEDSVNYRQPVYVVLGGNVNTGTVASFNGVIEESDWITKDGIYSGMNLPDLLRLNGSDIRFYGKKAECPFMLLPENRGSLNFKKDIVVLSCLNSQSSPLLDNKIVSAEEILTENPGMFVFMLLMKPLTDERKQEKSNTALR